MGMKLPPDQVAKLLSDPAVTVGPTTTATPSTGPGRSKFGNTPTEVDGVRFDSKREADRWRELLLLQAAGVVADLERQVRFPVVVNGVMVCEYVADFVYREGGARVVEDCKGFRTPVYRLKRKLMLAVHGVEIRET